MFSIVDVDANLGILKVTNRKDYNTQEFKLADKVMYAGPDNFDQGATGRIVQITRVNRLGWHDKVISKYKVQVELKRKGQRYLELRTFAKNFPFIHARMEGQKVD